MRFLAPAALFMALLALPVLLMYMLKLRRQDVEVSSTLLWQMLLRDRQANAPWQRLRRNLLLLLQLLILAGLVLALARPAVPVPSVVVGSVVVVIDASASMNATDVEPSRFRVALEMARQLVEDKSPEARMTVIYAGSQPQVLASQESDREALRRALSTTDLAPTQGETDWHAAFALAAGSAGGSAALDQAAVVIISDGGLPAGLPPLPVDARYIPVGTSGENLALRALALRPGTDGAELFTRLTNFGQSDRSAVLSFYINGELFSAQPVEIAPRASASLSITGLPEGRALYEARLSSSTDPNQPLDSLALDDVAFAVYQPPNQQTALLFPSQIQPQVTYNLFLQQVLVAVLGQGRSFQARPTESGSIELPEEAFSLYVYDGLLPDQLPPGNLLLINPPSSPLFPVGEVFSDTANVEVANHPLVRFVDWNSVHILRARQVERPPWAQVLVAAEAGPLVFAGETGGRRVAVLTFDLRDSDLPLQVTFPILMANLINYLAPGQGFEAPQGLRPGDSLTIYPRALPDGTSPQTIAIASPSGKVFSFAPVESGTPFIDTGELGLYAVNYLGRDSQAADYFAVNLFSEAESDIRPVDTITVGRSAVSASQPDETGQRELWPWLAAAALAVLVLEWWVYHRSQRLHLPGFGQIFNRR